MKRWAATGTVSPLRRPVASIVVDSPLTQFFCVSRKRVTAVADRKTWSGPISRDYPILVMELEVPKAELSGAAMRGSIGVFTGPETEI